MDRWMQRRRDKDDGGGDESGKKDWLKKGGLVLVVLRSQASILVFSGERKKENQEKPIVYAYMLPSSSFQKLLSTSQAYMLASVPFPSFSSSPPFAPLPPSPGIRLSALFNFSTRSWRKRKRRRRKRRRRRPLEAVPLAVVY